MAAYSWFWKSLFGLRAGDRRTVSLPPEDAFGPWNPENVQSLIRWSLNSVPLKGTWLSLKTKLKQSLWHGSENCRWWHHRSRLFNHPLAGKDITLKLKFQKWRPAGQQGHQNYVKPQIDSQMSAKAPSGLFNVLKHLSIRYIFNLCKALIFILP